MRISGIITEYNPLHAGHTLQIARIRELLGPDTAVVCVMSGNFVQRGDFAVVRKHVRAEAAVKSGANLVLELPLPWAVSSAERFADGGIQALIAAGVVTHLSFGSECGKAGSLQTVAKALCTEEFSPLLQRELKKGSSFAASRQAAAEKMLSQEQAALLKNPNDILGIEYCKSLLRNGSSIEPLAVPREGAAHDGGAAVDGIASASAIRKLLLEGRQDEALASMAPAMREGYLREAAAGRAPVFTATCERAILARLRMMSMEEFLELDEGHEGLGNRFYAAARTAATLGELFSTVKTKRYAYARLRRMVLWAYLGLVPAKMPERLPYLRVLASDAVGCTLLKKMRKAAAVPVLTKPADVRHLSETAQNLFQMEARATDLYTLANPNLSTALGGSEWREGPVIL